MILDSQHKLGLDALDLAILMHLAKFWWYRENPPHPSKKRIAECLGVDASTVRRRIARMEKDGFISRQSRFNSGTRRQETNFYHFDGLITAATPYAEEALQAKEERKAEQKAARTRKKPKFKLVKPTEGAGDD